MPPRPPFARVRQMTLATILDTHLHLVDRGALSYPWLAGVPALNQDFPLERCSVEAFRRGIGAAPHMEVDVAEDDIEAETSHVETPAERPASPLCGAISACRPKSLDFPALLERQLADPFVEGFRRVPQVVADEISLSATFRANAGRPFDLCVRPDQIDEAVALADLCPDAQFVLDHCGAPAIKDRAEHPWRESIAEIAPRPNVAVEISGVVAYADGESWTVDDIRPYVEHAIGCFGWNRVV